MGTAIRRRGERTAGVAVLAILFIALAGCTAPAAPDPPRSPAPMAEKPQPTPTPTPTPEPVARAFGGECDAVLEAAQVSAPAPGSIASDPVRVARAGLFEEASVVAVGGIVCPGSMDIEGVTVIVLPSVLEADGLSDNEYACAGAFTGCSWSVTAGEWWVVAETYPLDAGEWTADPAGAERTAELVASAAGQWSAPADAGAGTPAQLDCAALLATVSAAVPDADLRESGWGISGIEVIARETGLASGCAWADRSGMIDVLVQPRAGAIPAERLSAAQAVPLALPTGGAAYQFAFDGTYGTVLAGVGDLRVSVSGTTPAADPAQAAKILDALLAALA